MTLRVPPLTGLRTFVTAARTGSFLKAADELSVTPAAVSRSIRSLEDHLGCALFHRMHRQISLTEEGQAYLGGLGDVFDRIALATQNLSARRAQRPLVVCAYPSFIIDWLIPRWSRQQRRGTPLVIKLVTTQTHDVNFGNAGIDLAILSDRAQYPNCVCEKLFTASLVPVCSPSYTPAGTLTGAVEEWQDDLLHAETRPNDWARWAAANDCVGLDVSRGHRFESSMLMYQAAIAGLGIAVGIREVLSREFASNSLVIPFAYNRTVDCPYYLIYPPSSESHPSFSSFRDWVRAEVAQEQGQQPAQDAVRRDQAR